jgi:GNAT superfamily N-acetyltransferase
MSTSVENTSFIDAPDASGTHAPAEADQPASARVSWQVRALGANDAPAVLAHLMALSPEARRLRFGNAARDEVLLNYAQGIRFEADDVFGVFAESEEPAALAGLAHVVYGGMDATLADASNPSVAGAAEIGLSVLETYRKRGIGRALFDHAAMRARLRYVHTLKLAFLPENTAMQKLAQEAGMELHTVRGESEAYLLMRAANAADFGIGLVAPARVVAATAGDALAPPTKKAAARKSKTVGPTKARTPHTGTAARPTKTCAKRVTRAA